MSVYFARVGRYIKVGYSEDAERRVTHLFRSTTRYSRPWDMPLDAERELLKVIDGDLSTERACHAALDAYNAGGEWFIDEPGVRDFITRAASGDFSLVVRPEGQFQPVEWTEMPPEREAEIDRMIARARAKRAVA